MKNLEIKKGENMEPLSNILTVGMNDHGEMDFGVRATIADLSLEQMQEFRAIVCVAIGIAEDEWRRNGGQQQAVASA